MPCTPLLFFAASQRSLFRGEKSMDILLFIRATVGMVFVIFVPGFTLSWVFFPRRRDIDDLSRIGYSFVLSITFATLSVLFVDLVLGIDATTEVILATLCILILMGMGIWKVELLLLERFQDFPKPDSTAEEISPPDIPNIIDSMESKIHSEQEGANGAEPDIFPEEQPAESPSGRIYQQIKRFRDNDIFSKLRGLRMLPKK